MQSFAESNSRELRNAIERAIYGHYRETEVLEWSHLVPYLTSESGSVSEPPPARSEPSAAASSTPNLRPALNEWQKRLRSLAVKILAKGTDLTPEQARPMVEKLFEDDLPPVWQAVETARSATDETPTIPMPVWEDLWRCFAVSWLGGPTPAEKVLGIPANTLRQWINDRESR